MMNRTPDEINKGLECCGTGAFGNHKDCPYDIAEPKCMQNLLADALALIQQLQAENTEKDARIQQLESGLLAQAGVIATMGERIQQLEAERDALLDYLKNTTFAPCDICKEDSSPMVCKRLREVGLPCFEWRGLHKEG
jgi:hypothetical protein